MHNMNMTRRALGAAAIALSLAATAAFAQQPGRIRGQIEKADGAMLALKTRDGTMLNVKVADDARVSALVKATLADIKTDSFIGIAGIPEPDGSIKAFSIHIFLPAQRGVVPDRHGPWDAQAGQHHDQRLCRGHRASKDGETLTVKYKDGEKKDRRHQGDGDRRGRARATKDELKAGTPIIIMASEKQADGSVLAKVIYVGRDGPAGDVTA